METTNEELAAVVAAEPQPTVAVIGRIVNVHAIDGADRIHLVAADCGDHGVWHGVVPKSTVMGDTVLVLLQDALLPADGRWVFMESRHWRVRMARFKGCPSECVILPAEGDETQLEVGTDVGARLGITKYSKPIPATMVGKAAGNFPSYIPKTDEPNFQRVRDRDALMAGDWYATEKADGTSVTFFMKDGELRLCSRNWELERSGGGVYWDMADKYGMARLPENVALQAEIVGPGIQGNPMGLDACEIRVFTGHYFGPQEQCSYAAVGRMTYADLVSLCASLSLPMARLVEGGRGSRTNDELQKMAEIKYPNGRHGEGIVVRCVNSDWSFKVISLLYKD